MCFPRAEPGKQHNRFGLRPIRDLRTRGDRPYGRLDVYKTPNIRNRVLLIVGITAVFIVGLAAFLFWYLGGQEKAATAEAKKFIAALEKHDPSAGRPTGRASRAP